MQTNRGLRLAIVLFLLWLGWIVIRRMYLTDPSLWIWLLSVFATAVLVSSFGWVLRGWTDRRGYEGRKSLTMNRFHFTIPHIRRSAR